MKTKGLVALAGGALLASVAYFVSSRPAVTANEPVQVEASPAIPAAPQAVPEIVPAAQPEPPPPQPVTPASKRRTAKAFRNAKRFDPKPPNVAAAPVAARFIIAEPPELSDAVEAPELVLANFPSESATELLQRRIATIPEKTAITIRLGERLATDRSLVGDAFFGTLDVPLVVNGWVIADRGARVLGRVTDIVPAGRVQGVALLTLELYSVTASDGQRIPVRTASFVYKGDTSKKDDAADHTTAGSTLQARDSSVRPSRSGPPRRAE